MRKLIMSLALILGLAVAANAQSTSLFNANELSISLGTAYAVDTSAANVKGAFAKDYKLNANAGVAYFATQNLGVDATVPFYSNGGGWDVKEAGVGLLARVPVGPIAPYVGVGGIYNWSGVDKNLDYNVKAGVELRVIKHVGTFVEADYRNDNFNLKQGSTTLQGGLRFVF